VIQELYRSGHKDPMKLSFSQAMLLYEKEIEIRKRNLGDLANIMRAAMWANKNEFRNLIRELLEE